MLEVQTGSELIDRLWDKLPERTEVPGDEHDFFSAEGVAKGLFEDRRGLPRRHYRDRAIVTTGGEQLGAYTLDATRVGVGLITSRQFFPQDSIRVLLPSGKRPELTVCWCRRLGERCYAIGCKRATSK